MSFRKSFRKKEQLIAPEHWFEHLNLRAPKGTHYQKLDDNTVILRPDQGETSFVVKLSLPTDLQHISINNVDDLFELLYRAQREPIVEILHYIVGGNEVSEKDYTTQFGNNDTIHLKHSMFMEEFPPPFDLHIMMNNNKYPFKMERIPFASLTESIFKSNNYSLFDLTLRLDESTNKFNLQFHYDLTRAKTINETLSYESMILDYTTGKIEVLELKQTLEKKEANKHARKVFSYYRKLQEIENHFNISFDLSDHLTITDLENLEKIYISFILNQFYYSPDFKIDELKFTINKNLETEESKNIYSQNESAAFAGDAPLSFSLLGHNFTFIEKIIFPKTSFKNQNTINNAEYEIIVDVQNANDLQIKYSKLFDSSNDLKTTILDMNDLVLELENAVCIDFK